MNNNIKEFDVFTDNESIWMRESDLIQIARQIPINKLMAFDIMPDSKFDKTEPFIKIGLDLLKFIRNNTANPAFKAHPIMVESKKTKDNKENKGKSK